jgi:hypothetical protein
MIVSITSPVSGGGALPGDRDADVDAGRAGEGDGQVSGELEQHSHGHLPMQGAALPPSSPQCRSARRTAGHTSLARHMT